MFMFILNEIFKDEPFVAKSKSKQLISKLSKKASHFSDWFWLKVFHCHMYCEKLISQCLFRFISHFVLFLIITSVYYSKCLGSPLKSNNLSALAYSPNQRNAFIQQQLHQQQNVLNTSTKSSQGKYFTLNMQQFIYEILFIFI